MKKTLLLILLALSGLLTMAQNTSPLVVKDFSLKPNEFIDKEQIPKNSRKDMDNNPICRIKVRVEGLEENELQQMVFLSDGFQITHTVFKNGMWYLHVSSRKIGDLIMKYKGDCVFRLPYQLEPDKVYELTLSQETATVVVKTIPSEAEIYIDNEFIGKGYAGKALSIGTEHICRVQCHDYQTKEMTLFFNERENREINVKLEPDFSYITIKSAPRGAEVYIDGKMVGTTPYLMERIRTGNHKVELKKEGFDTYIATVTINAGEEVNTQLDGVMLVQKEVSANDDAQPKDDFVYRTVTAQGVSFDMVLVKGGTFDMGCIPGQDGNCSKQVTVGDFYIGKLEVTNELWSAVMGSNPSEWKDGDLPVENITRVMADSFVSKLSKITAETFSIPTEVEWEYAAKGGEKSKGYKYSGSDNLDNVAWYEGNSDKNKPQQVGTKQPNELGIYDMTGNVWEFCQEKRGMNSVVRGGGVDTDERLSKITYNNYVLTFMQSTSKIGLRVVMHLK